MRGTKVRKWLDEHQFEVGLVAIFVIMGVILTIAMSDFGARLFDTDRVIYRTIRAYKHLPNGNTDIYYKDGAIEIEGTWYFNLDTSYEFYREENSTVWKVDPY